MKQEEPHVVAGSIGGVNMTGKNAASDMTLVLVSWLVIVVLNLAIVSSSSALKLKHLFGWLM